MKKREDSAESMRTAIEGWRGLRVVIFGDMILDEFVYGRTERVSREAPVVIVRYDGSGFGAGGAANAVQNVAALGGKAVPVGFIGGDDSGKRLKLIFADKGLGTGGLVTLPDRGTTSKMRIMAGDYHAQRQQIVRIDREQQHDLSRREEDRIIKRFERRAAAADAVILSDYNQRLFSDRVIHRAISFCRQRSLPVVADSRFRLNRFHGVTTATPNEVEAAEAAGIELGSEGALGRIGRKLLGGIGADSLIITRGRFGMALFEPRKRMKTVEVVGSPEAIDVTGAGDTVVAAVALTLASCGDMPTAMRIANNAASIVVMKRGTATAGADEVLRLVDRIGASKDPERCG